MTKIQVVMKNERQTGTATRKMLFGLRNGLHIRLRG